MGQAKKRGSIEERTAKAIEVQQAKAAEARQIEEQESGPRASQRGTAYMQFALMAAAMSLPPERPRTEMTLTNIHHPDFPEMRPRKKKFERRRP